jgi:tetratricopeptide (TPR) repeat protein
VPAAERNAAGELLVALAEAYEGEHGLAYATAALDIDPGHDRGIQLYAHYANQLGQVADVARRHAAYLSANPTGAMAEEVRNALEVKDTDSVPESQGIGLSEQLEPLSHRFAPSPSGTIVGVGPGPGERAAQVRNTDASPASTRTLLEAAHALASKGKKPEAFAQYKEILESDPSQEEALAWSGDYLRSKRDYGQLRDLLLASVRSTAGMPDTAETRKERLREIAGLCDGNLRDVDGAIQAWRQLLALDRKDESARGALLRLLEKSQRWDDLANLLEQEATIESDIETKVALEKKLAKLQEDKRKDLVAAGQAWVRIARALADDPQAILNASRLFDKAQQPALSASILEEGAPGIEEPLARGPIFERLAELRAQMGDETGAGDAYALAAEALHSSRLWDEADRMYCASKAWEKAANAAHQRGLLTTDPRPQASFFARAAEYLFTAGLAEVALSRLEQATSLDPLNDDYANQLVARYTADLRYDKLVAFFERRGDSLTDRSKRTHARREAATLAMVRLQDKALARELWLKLLEDGDDKEALLRLTDDAIERGDPTEATTLLRRLGRHTVDASERALIALREADLLANSVGDVDTAMARYERILADLDPTCRPALAAIANLEEARGDSQAAAHALERELKLISEPAERGPIAARLARLYDKLNEPTHAIRALDLVRNADLDDFDALARLCELCEQTEQWSRLAALLVERIEHEADEDETVALTKKLATTLADRLDRGDEALAALAGLADQGEASIRAVYIALGDRLGQKAVVATKLNEWWFDARRGKERDEALRGAFERFFEVGRDADAITVAMELIRGKSGDTQLATRLEGLAVKAGDHDALVVAQDVLARHASPSMRAAEIVRQAEVRVHAGMPRTEALLHGEQGLAGVPAGEVGPLLDRLATLANQPTDVIDLYERQVARTKGADDRLRALARAAQIASSAGHPARARALFELALSGTPTSEAIDVLEACASEGDHAAHGDILRRTLCQALATGGHGARDGGRTRASMLRRAALIMHRDLHDIDQAFAWLGEALVAHVDEPSLEMIESLAATDGNARRAESALTNALGEVFDGPLVRLLLARRANVRRKYLGDLTEAAVDLKKLHDLSPQDQSVMDDLAALYMQLNDYRSLVHVYEDQLLRGKDMNARAELARQVARIWEERLADTREAADAWRRVLRMLRNDEEALAGLERAKAGQLKTSDGDPTQLYAPPRLTTDRPVAIPTHPQPQPKSAPPPLPVSDTGSARPKAPSQPPPLETGSRMKTLPEIPPDMQSVPPPLESRPRTAPPPLPRPSFHAMTAVGAPDEPSLDAEIDNALSDLDPFATGGHSSAPAKAASAHDALRAGAIEDESVDVDLPQDDLDAALAGGEEDEIVIADDLAEELSDDGSDKHLPDESEAVKTDAHRDGPEVGGP